MMPQKKTLCEICLRSAPRKGEGCPWSMRFEAVEGWTATPTRFLVRTSMKEKGVPPYRAVDSYLVHACPLFVSDRRRRALMTNEDGLFRLIAAILRQAEMDYRDARLKKPSTKTGKAYNRPTLEELERFYQSTWCDRLCLGHGAKLYEQVKGEYA